MPLRFRKYIHFYTKFPNKLEPILYQRGRIKAYFNTNLETLKTFFSWGGGSLNKLGKFFFKFTN